MKKNIGTLDRVIRLLLAAVFSILFITQTVTGIFGVILLILGGVFILTSFISFCPIYALFGINSCKK